MKPVNIIVHHTATSRRTTSIEAVNNYHKNKDWGDGARGQLSELGWYVAYHYFIDNNGIITQCANDDETRWHAGERNGDSLGICLAGRFDRGHDSSPSMEQVASLKKLLNEKSKQYNIPKSRIVPHRKYAKKTCYGDNLDDAWASNLISNETPMMKKYEKKLVQDVDQTGGFGLVLDGEIHTATPERLPALLATYLMCKEGIPLSKDIWNNAERKPL